MKKQVFKNKEEGIFSGVCYGLVKSLEIKTPWLEKTVLYVLRGIFLLTIAFGLVGYMALAGIMIDENNNEKKKFVKLRKNRFLPYFITVSLVFLCVFALSPFASSSQPIGMKGVASSCIIRFLNNNLHNPSSLDIIACSDVIKVNDEKYVQRVKYRATNVFGGYVVDTKDFYMVKDGNRKWKVLYAQ